MKTAKYVALLEKRDAAARGVVRAVKRWEKLTQQVRRAERTLDKQFNTEADGLGLPVTPTIPGQVDLDELAKSAALPRGGAYYRN